MKKLLKSFSPLVAFILILNNPIIAQLNSTELITTTTDRDRDDDNGKWGLIGLVGLPGLMGLKKMIRQTITLLPTHRKIVNINGYKKVLRIGNIYAAPTYKIRYYFLIN